jgi:hypothetical protein
MRITREEFDRLDLRAHALLAGVPVHDVWAIDLPDGGPGRTIADLRPLLSGRNLMSVSPAVKFLFALRWQLGRLFAWDHEPPGASEESWLHRLSPADREGSLVPPGTREGPFRVLFTSPRETILEIQNATVHGFSVFALVESVSGYRFYWGVYVRPVGRLTAWYMRLIDPFRRILIYPAVLRHVRTAWSRRERIEPM